MYCFVFSDTVLSRPIQESQWNEISFMFHWFAIRSDQTTFRARTRADANEKRKFQEVEMVWEGKRICNQIAPYRFLPMYWFNHFTQSFWYLSECWCVLRNFHCYVTNAKIEYPNRMIAFWNWNSFLQRVLIGFPQVMILTAIKQCNLMQMYVVGNQRKNRFFLLKWLVIMFKPYMNRCLIKWFIDWLAAIPF